jgi:hypothetical protein
MSGLNACLLLFFLYKQTLLLARAQENRVQKKEKKNQKLKTLRQKNQQFGLPSL